MSGLKAEAFLPRPDSNEKQNLQSGEHADRGKMGVNIQVRLADHLRHFTAAPFLFVGSGLSRRYVGLETWQTLLERFCKVIDADFGFLSSKADGHFPTLAKLLAEEFLEKWWKSPKFRKSRTEFKKIATRKESPLKIEIAKYIRGLAFDPDDMPLNEEIKALKAAQVDGIITTNWDLFLENVFPDFEVFKGQEELLFSHPQSIAEIYKIHGCCTVPNSLILTDEDYRDFNSRNPYLAAKLLTIFIEHPVIFLGYSLSDENVIGVLNSITSCLGTENLQKLSDRLIFVQRSHGKEEDFFASMISIDRKTLPVTVIKTDDYAEVYTALGVNKRKFPAKLLRKLKSHLYELVQQNDPGAQIYVSDLDQESDGLKIEIVYGVGITRRLGDAGYTPIKNDALMRDVVYDENLFDAAKVASQTLPSLLKATRYVPVFKYLAMAGYFSPGSEKLQNLDGRVAAASKATTNNFLPPGNYQAKRNKVQALKGGVDKLQTEYDLYHVALYIPLLDKGYLKLDELEAFLRKNYDALNVKCSTELRKLVCLYDLLKYGPLEPTKAASVKVAAKS